MKHGKKRKLKASVVSMTELQSKSSVTQPQPGPERPGRLAGEVTSRRGGEGKETGKWEGTLHLQHSSIHKQSAYLSSEPPRLWNRGCLPHAAI